jgi:hypothetical protein
MTDEAFAELLAKERSLWDALKAREDGLAPMRTAWSEAYQSVRKEESMREARAEIKKEAA